jgi:uncharacterized low-complexity protein
LNLNVEETPMSKMNRNPLTLALGAAFAMSGAVAQASLFQTADLGTGYMVAAAGDGKAAEHKCGEGKCGEGKCGAKGGDADKAAKTGEHKCGEGKCGEKKPESKAGEHKCGEKKTP